MRRKEKLNKKKKVFSLLLNNNNIFVLFMIFTFLSVYNESFEDVSRNENYSALFTPKIGVR